jgi:hypothetical protein
MSDKVPTLLTNESLMSKKHIVEYQHRLWLLNHFGMGVTALGLTDEQVSALVEIYKEMMANRFKQAAMAALQGRQA